MAGNFDPDKQVPKHREHEPQRRRQPQGDAAMPARTVQASFSGSTIGGKSATDVMSQGGWGSSLDALLDELRNLTDTTPLQPVVEGGVDNQLVQVRLGMAASLFMALRCRDPLTAAHALRVALITSAWCLKMNLSSHQRDVIEVAALLHDLGVIAIPDKVLHKPANLDCKEATVVERARQMSVEILRSACSEPLLLEIIENISVRFDGAGPGCVVNGQDIPLGSRMIAIVESYDSMTSDHVFRPAMSQETAMRELFVCAGSQFDPHLVEEFALLQSCDQSAYRREVISRWLHDLDPDVVESYWELSHGISTRSGDRAASLFESKLLGKIHDAIIFIDETLTITFWNNAAERMTGISVSSICGRHWTPSLLNLRDEQGRVVQDDDCPIACAIATGVQSVRRLSIQNRKGSILSIDTHVIPVIQENNIALGAALVLHDASNEKSLEDRCQDLHEISTRDPLTQVGNRAEFDRVHERFVQAHLQQQRPCSLIICDLDLFKQVNDNYGHQAGDDVIKSMANVLKDSCRAGDLVARYGGEEFVMLCADCDNATTALRAEQIRKTISQIPQPLMGGNTITASFGVTEVQPGDRPETMLRRADRALLTAKAQGRNRVVQLGIGSLAADGRSYGMDSFADFRPSGDSRVLFEQDLYTSVPMSVAVEKLRGFIADHEAKLIDIDESNVRMEMTNQTKRRSRRRSDRPTTFTINIHLEECRNEISKSDGGKDSLRNQRPTSTRLPRTQIHFSIAARKKRDRRDNNVLRQAREMLVSFRSYLMVTDSCQNSNSGHLNQSQHFWDSWLCEHLVPLESSCPTTKTSSFFWRIITRGWKWS